MAWIESHSTMPMHPKTMKLARRLGVSKPAAIGHLHFLWWWCLKHRPDGVLTGLTSDEIAEAAGWDGDHRLLLDTLIEARLVDVDGDHIAVHNWSKYRKSQGHRWVPYAVRLKLWLRDGWGCANCGASCGDLQVDHVMPRSRGGPDRMDNYQWLCGWCNRAKGSLLPDDWSKVSNRAALSSPCRPQWIEGTAGELLRAGLPDCGHDPEPVQQRIAAVS